MALCGHVLPPAARDGPWPPRATAEELAAFDAFALSREAFDSDPSLLFHPHLRVRLRPRPPGVDSCVA